MSTAPRSSGVPWTVEVHRHGTVTFRPSPPPTSSSTAATGGPGSTPRVRPGSSGHERRHRQLRRVRPGPVAPDSRGRRYQALEYGAGAESGLGQDQGAADSAVPTLREYGVGESVDNAGGAEWDEYAGSPLTRRRCATYELDRGSAMPLALQITPTNAGAPKGVPSHCSRAPRSTGGRPDAGRSLRDAITGVNAAPASVTLGPDGHGDDHRPGH